MGRVLCVRHEPFDSMGLAPGALRSGGLNPVVLDAWRAGADWPALGDFDALIVFGGSMSSLDDGRYPFLEHDRLAIGEALRREMPLLGVCLGAQLIALTLGARVMPAPQREVGFLPVALNPAGRQDPILSALPDGALCFQWHEDTFDLPAEAIALATGESGITQAYRVGSALAVQFHPEVTADELDEWIDLAGVELESEWGRSAADLRAEIARHIAAHNERGRAMFQAFAREVTAALARRPA
jgi:GMP synthase (glutamine-hydrolysing)